MRREPSPNEKLLAALQGAVDRARALRRQCGEEYAVHPTQPHLTAVCVRPAGHEGEHSNVLPKVGPR